MNDFISHIEIIQLVYLAVTIKSAFGRKTKENLVGFYKVVSLLRILYLNLVRWYIYISEIGSNISKTSARVSSGVPNTKKQMRARDRMPSAFIVSRCLVPLMKPEARVFEMTSQTKQ